MRRSPQRTGDPARVHNAAVGAVEFQVDDRSRTPDGDPGRAVASAWYARGTLAARRAFASATPDAQAARFIPDGT